MTSSSPSLPSCSKNPTIYSFESSRVKTGFLVRASSASIVLRWRAKSPVRYSCRSATMGSTFVARRAGR